MKREVASDIVYLSSLVTWNLNQSLGFNPRAHTLPPKALAPLRGDKSVASGEAVRT